MVSASAERESETTFLCQNYDSAMSPVCRLPFEMLLEIISHLAPMDLKSAVLVCRRWREVGEEPKLWSWAALKLTPQFMLAAECRRMKTILHVKPKEGKVWELPNLTVKALSKVLLSNNLANLSEVCEEKDGYYCGGLLEASMKALKKQDKKKEFSFKKIDFSEIDETLLAEAFNKLSTLNLEECKFSSTQITKFLESDETKLNSLSLIKIDLTGIDARFMAQSLNRITLLGLNTCKMSPMQIIMLFEQLLEVSKVSQMEINGMDLTKLITDIYSKMRGSSRILELQSAISRRSSFVRVVRIG